MRLSHTAGLSLAPTDKLRVRIGAGYSDELLAMEDSEDPEEVDQAATRMVLKAGAVLSPTTVVIHTVPIMTIEEI